MSMRCLFQSFLHRVSFPLVYVFLTTTLYKKKRFTFTITLHIELNGRYVEII
jgi:hypothetical protein